MMGFCSQCGLMASMGAAHAMPAMLGRTLSSSISVNFVGSGPPCEGGESGGYSAA